MQAERLATTAQRSLATTRSTHNSRAVDGVSHPACNVVFGEGVSPNSRGEEECDEGAVARHDVGWVEDEVAACGDIDLGRRFQPRRRKAV